MKAGDIPVILLVRDQTVLPHVKAAQNTSAIDWKNVELRIFSSEGADAAGKFSLPDGKLETLLLQRSGNRFGLKNDPFRGSVTWTPVGVVARP
jgi:alpha-D-xyloside xylohydrolase